MSRSPKVSALELAAFAAPAAPLLALTLPTVMFLPPYFIEHVGLEEGVVGALFLAARMFDIVLDPTLGTLQDRTETRWGRRRIWLAGATPFLMAATTTGMYSGRQPAITAAIANIASGSPISRPTCDSWPTDTGSKRWMPANSRSKGRSSLKLSRRTIFTAR